MDAEEIQNRLLTLGRKQFVRVVSLFLKQVLRFDAINVDAGGDGGSDWQAFEEAGQRLRIAIQDTTQNQNWEKKALDDAKKAAAELNVNRYLFFTNRSRQSGSIVQLEQEIDKVTGLATRIYGAREIAETLYEKGLGAEFLNAIGDPVAPRPPELPEICLCVYGNLSADRTNHRDAIYSDTLLVACRDSSISPTRESLLDSAILMLAADVAIRPILNRKIDSLLSYGQIVQSDEKRLSLSTEAEKKISETERLYLSDWAALESEQSAVMRTLNADWDESDSRISAASLAKMFIQNQLDSLHHARIGGLSNNWTQRLGNPEQQLRDQLQRKGLSGRNITKTVSKFVNLAKDRDVIKKLTRTAVFVALEGRDPMLNSAALGRRSWSEIHVLLDSSVAIPFLCEQLFGKVDDYIFALSGQAVLTFQKLQAACVMLRGYIEECAAHLIQAFLYEAVEATPELANSLRLSENAFVAYYHAWKSQEKENGVTLLSFLESFSRKAQGASRLKSLPEATRAIMPEIQSLLNDYKVSCNSLRQGSAERYGALQKAFDLECMSSGRNQPLVLRTHDIDALTHLAVSTEQKNESWMTLSWDKAFVAAARKELPAAFSLTPETAIDFAQPCKKLSETQFCALSHRIAATTPSVDELTARVIDKLMNLHPEKLRDADFRKQLIEFRDEASARMPSEGGDKIHSWVDGETSEFFKKHDLSQEKQIRTPLGESQST